MKKLLSSLALAIGLFSPAVHAATFDISTVADMEAYRDDILEAWDAETYDMLLKAVENGSQLSVTIDDSLEDGGGDRGGRDRECTVKVTENRGGSVGGGGPGVNGNAEGHNNRTYEISGPCNEVKEILREIIGGSREPVGPGRK